MLSDIFKAIELIRSETGRSHDEMASILKMGADQAAMIADLWTDIYLSISGPYDKKQFPNFEENQYFNRLTLNQHRAAFDLKLLYEHFFQNTRIDTLNGAFAVCMRDLLNRRDEAKILLGGDRKLIDWASDDDVIYVKSMREAVLHISEESCRLKLLANKYRINYSIGKLRFIRFKMDNL